MNNAKRERSRKLLLIMIISVLVLGLVLVLITGFWYGMRRANAFNARPLVLIHTPINHDQVNLGDGILIHATARLRQLSMGLSNDETCQLAAEAEAAADTIFLVEIDPRDGSGVIPREWTAMLSPRPVSGQSPRRVTGVSNPGLRKVPALSGAQKGTTRRTSSGSFSHCACPKVIRCSPRKTARPS